ncbi:MAG: Ig-like domain-containing protein [Isosphaerales bacterium]
MGSFKGYGRQEGPARRRNQKNPQRQGRPSIEFLEARQLLSGTTSTSTTIPAPLWTPTDTNLFDAQNGPMANLGVGVVGVYQAYVQSGGNTSQLAAEFPTIEFQNGLVGVSVKSLGGDFNQFVTQLTDVGMQIQSTSTTDALVDGWAPINELPTIASLNQTMSGVALYYPVTSSEYQGVAYNEAETSLFADVARTQYNVDGTGVTVGVLSDSVSQYAGGLADSYKTGDLSSTNPVKVLQDGPAGSTDEGRAMLENIHDIAPGANLQFATAAISEVSFGQNIQALQAAGSQLIVDDIKYADEPMFQDGVVAQGVNAVVKAGATYFSAAGNEGPDSGYLSTFRPMTDNIPGIGSGTFMNFAPTGTNDKLQITVNNPNFMAMTKALVTFEYDQPYQFQEPAGSPGVVSSNVNIYILDGNGNVVVGPGMNQNNVAMQQPWQFVGIPSNGTYYVVIQVVSGPNPGHVEFMGFNDSNGVFNVDQTYGSAGGTSYPSTFGHQAAANTIGVGATPWWAPSPYLGQNPLANEPFSSSGGPSLTVFDPTGVPLASPVPVQNPTVTAPDGGNTSFFSAGFTLDTSNPPFPGEPASTTNLVPANQQALPVFFGTSSAAPNTAAVAALMLEKVPQLTPAQIRQGLEESAIPMNGQAQGTWITADGYGLVNAVSAINAVDVLRVSSTNPANGAIVTVAPSTITVTFNKAVNFSTVSAADLTFTAEPIGVTVNVGTPIAVDNPTDPTIIQWPFSFTRPVGVLANGTYTFSIQSTANNPVVSEDGKDLVPSGPISFKLADVTAPVITKTSVSGRAVSVTFSKAIDPATATLANILVIRQGSATSWPPNSTNLASFINGSNGGVNLNSDPRSTISYNPQTNTATLSYNGLPQTELPADNYAIVVLSKNGTSSGVTDLVGNSLDGNFTGSFPSGADGLPENFIQNLGLQALSAPIITTFEMEPTPANDTGIVGDQNTNISQPVFIGQVYAPFPGTVAGLQVYVEFSGLHNGNITLAVGGGGRGYTGTYDAVVTTDADGAFSVTAPPLPEGFQQAVAVVVGEPDKPPLPGLSASYADAFRIDKTSPQITGASFTVGGPNLPLPNGPQPNITPVPSLTALSLSVVDVVNQAYAALDTPASVLFPALNPATAANISNYSLVNTSNNFEDESQYIATATFVANSPPANPVLDSTGTYVLEYTGHIDLTFLPGLPAGVYTFVAHTTELQYPGLTDAAANPLDDTNVPGEGNKSFIINFDVQPQPVYITSMALESSYNPNGSTVIGTEQSYFEVPPSGTTNTRDNVAAPPTAVVVDFSNPLPYSTVGLGGIPVPINYASDLQLIQSANSANGTSDGDFGNLGQGGLGSTGKGFNLLQNYQVTLQSYNTLTQTWSKVTAPGESGTRLVLQLDAGVTLAPDDYRIYVPNQLEPGNVDTRIYDIYGNQLDGENLGNQTAQTGIDFPTLPNYEDLQTSGTYRQNDMSGDGVPGGAFMAGFTVVPYGNVVYARPDYVESPLLPSTLSNGSLANPYPVLAPEGNPSTAPANPTHDPNGGLNSTFFYQPGNFNSAYDFSGDGKFEQSALYAASQLAYVGPVVVVALPGIPQRSPVTGQVTQAAFVLQAPAGNRSGVTNGSASVPYNTTLVFAAGSTLKLQNASLYVQNQGSALQADGTSTNPVNFTSYNDATIGGATNNNPDTNPHAGDWGGIVFRNYDEAIASQKASFPVDGTLVGPGGSAAVSGASDVMSILNYVNVRYAGGAVPQGSSSFYSGITLYNSRPTITNAAISDSGGAGGTEAAIGADLDSFREDDSARGPLVRRATVINDSLNGIWLTSESNGYIEPTNAMPYPTNPTTLGGSQNYTLYEPLPFIVLAQLVVGQEMLVNTGGQTAFITDRLYIQPGVLMKMNKGSGLNVLNPGASLNIGSRSYINGFDQNSSYSPLSTNFVEESASDPTVLFTSVQDDAATTTLVPNPIDVTGEKTTPALTAGMWASVGIQSGGIAVINAATFQYGGGADNTPTFTIPSQSVLSFITSQTFFPLPPTASADLGSTVYITNNNFFHNFDAAMQIEPNGLLAGNPLTPLLSGHPFFRGNVMQGNGIDGLSVITARVYLLNAATNYNYLGPVEAIGVPGYVNQTVSTVWDSTDLTYVLRGTIVLAGSYSFFGGNISTPTPNLTAYGPIVQPSLSLTIQSALPGTLLANGETIPSPGQSVIVKMLNDEVPNNLGAANLATLAGSTGTGAAENAGAGFVVGVDDGVDPTPSPLVDPGAYSQLRILGIPGNQTTGQQRVPVIMTSLRDDTVGTTVRGVQMDNIFNSFPTQNVVGPNYVGQSLTVPKAGDGGYIYIGGNSLTEYDPTNPMQGSYISNADISYMSRIEVQGGGIVDSFNPAGTAGLPPAFSWLAQKTGYVEPRNQINSAMMFTIADSNLSFFSDAAVFVHPELLSGLYRDYTLATGTFTPFPQRGSLRGEPVYLYMYNDTISNSGQGVHINSENTNDTSGESAYQAVLLNNTFYDDPFALQTIAPQYNGMNLNAHVSVLAMNNIFDGSTQIAVDQLGQNGLGQEQYNLFFNNASNLNITTNDGDWAANNGAIYADPQFVSAATGNFELEPTSPAINQARSEIGPLPAGNAIYPTTTLSLIGGVATQIRTDPNSLLFPQEPGRDTLFGGFSLINDPSQIVTLPGSGFFNFPDQWQPALSTDSSGYSTPGQVPGTYNYAPVSGQRDVLGFIRAPISGGGVGFGSNPFIDIGAYQYVNLHPPEVTGVTETPTQGATPVNFYTVGGLAGTNQTPWSINITFNGPIDPNSITASTVNLVNLGSNPSQPLDQQINLAGKLSYDSSTDTLIISLGAAALTLGTDAYQITLFGSGSPVLTNPQGVALDGENTVGGTSTGAQLALPSGNGYPGGNFFDSFIINTTPPSVLAGSLKMDPASDTNIVGDNITYSTLPTFDGTVSEPNPQLVPLAGQTAIVDVGIEVVVNGVPTTFFDPSQLPSNLSILAQYIRPNAGSGTSTAGGAFKVSLGVDGANTGLVTDKNPLPNLQGFYNVGLDGLLSPLPGDDSGYYVARARIIDQSGNQSNPSDPNAQAPFVVDTTPPTINFVSPTAGQVLTTLVGGQITFTITASENIDLTHFFPTVINAGPDGILGTKDDVKIPINAGSIKLTLLDKGKGGQGAEEISFSTSGALTNNLYQITLPALDIAGNVTTATEQFVVDVPSLAQNFFVGGPQYVSNPLALIGSRENPYPTISKAITAATPGDVVAVLPGVYTEQVTLKQFVRVLSADPSSTDGTVFTTSTGDALSTIIRAPFQATAPVGTYATVSATGLESFAQLATEVAGFTIASPLVVDPANGFINPNAVAVLVSNSNILIDKDFIIDAGAGINVTTSVTSGGPTALTPQIENDGVIGNIEGVVIIDGGGTTSQTNPVNLINNDFAFNTYGLVLSNTATTPLQAYVASNIFWENHDQSLARPGYAIFSSNPGKVSLQNNLFSGNGASETSQANATNDLGNGFDPALLGPTAQDAENNLGNFTGNPAFVFPIDPRPGSDGPATFFLDGDYQLTAVSAAIDNAWEATAITTDFLGNSQIKIAGAGLGVIGYGPRDVGAFEYNGIGGNPVGGAFRVVTTTLVPIGGEIHAAGTTINLPTGPTSVTVTFSKNVNPSDITATDLVLSGSAANAVRATSLTWIDAHTVQFNLSSPLATSGTVDVSVAPGTIESTIGSANLGYSDNVVLNIGTITTPVPTPTPPTTPVIPVTPAPAPAPSPVTPAPAPAPAPKGPLHAKKAHHVVHHPVKHVVVPKPKHKSAKSKKAI